MKTNRRKFIKQVGMGALGAGVATSLPLNLYADSKSPYEISLAQFSLASGNFSGKDNILDFPARAKNEFGISIVEYVGYVFW